MTRTENYARQAFARSTGGHICDLITELIEGDDYLIGCPEHGYAMMRYTPTPAQARRLRKKARS